MHLLIALALAAPAGSAAPNSEPSTAEGKMWEVLGHFDSFPGAEPYAVADQISVQDGSMQAAAFETRAPAADVLKFYRAEFQRESLQPVDNPADITAFAGISAYDPKEHLQKTVVVMNESGGVTRVTLSIALQREILKMNGRGDLTGGLPVHPTGHPFRSDSVDGAIKNSVVTYQAGVPSTDLVAWLRPRLSSLGWTEDSAAHSSGLRFRRGSENLTVMVLGHGPTCEVSYVLIH